MGVNLQEQQRLEAELRRKLDQRPPPPDSDDEDDVRLSGLLPPASSSSSSSAAAAAAAAAPVPQPDMIDKAGNFFKTLTGPVAMFTSEPSLSAANVAAKAPAPAPAPTAAPAAASSALASSSQPQNHHQNSLQDLHLPPPPSNAPGAQDYQRKSLRGTSDARGAIFASEKVVRPLTLTPAPKVIEARGAKPDFLTPPPPQAPAPSHAAPINPPPDASLMSSVECVTP
jgi:hypothetical protein